MPTFKKATLSSSVLDLSDIMSWFKIKDACRSAFFQSEKDSVPAALLTMVEHCLDSWLLHYSLRFEFFC